MPSNPGRFIIFGKLGIPIVTDFYPSALQFIKDEYNGMLACSMGGWYRALRSLIESAELRQKIADAMHKTINKYFDFGKQNADFMDFLEHVMKEVSLFQKIYINEPEDDISRRFDFWKGIMVIKMKQIQRKIASALSPAKSAR